MPKRCSFGCDRNPGKPIHRFPHPKRHTEQFKEWVQLVGGKLETEADYEFFRTSVICDIHFTADVRNRNNRLNAVAYPTIHLKALHRKTSSKASTKSKSTVEPRPKSKISLTGLPNNKTSTQSAPTTKSISDRQSLDDKPQSFTPNESITGLSELEASTEVKSKLILDPMSNVDISQFPTGLSDDETSTESSFMTKTILDHISFESEESLTGLSELEASTVVKSKLILDPMSNVDISQFPTGLSDDKTSTQSSFMTKTISDHISFESKESLTDLSDNITSIQSYSMTNNISDHISFESDDSTGLSDDRISIQSDSMTEVIVDHILALESEESLTGLPDNNKTLTQSDSLIEDIVDQILSLESDECLTDLSDHEASTEVISTFVLEPMSNVDISQFLTDLSDKSSTQSSSMAKNMSDHITFESEESLTDLSDDASTESDSMTENIVDHILSLESEESLTGVPNKTSTQSSSMSKSILDLQSLDYELQSFASNEALSCLSDHETSTEIKSKLILEPMSNVDILQFPAGLSDNKTSVQSATMTKNMMDPTPFESEESLTGLTDNKTSVQSASMTKNMMDPTPFVSEESLTGFLNETSTNLKDLVFISEPILDQVFTSDQFLTERKKSANPWHYEARCGVDERIWSAHLCGLRPLLPILYLSIDM